MVLCCANVFSLPIGESILLRVSRAYTIWSGLGMSIQGVRTCGDYMFSGHTVALTILNFFITECKSNHNNNNNNNKIRGKTNCSDNHRIINLNAHLYFWHWIITHRYAATPLLSTHDDMAVEYVWHFLHIGCPWALLDWCVCRLLYHIKTVLVLSHTGQQSGTKLKLKSDILFDASFI